VVYKKYEQKSIHLNSTNILSKPGPKYWDFVKPQFRKEITKSLKWLKQEEVVELRHRSFQHKSIIYNSGLRQLPPFALIPQAHQTDPDIVRVHIHRIFRHEMNQLRFYTCPV